MWFYKCFSFGYIILLVLVFCENNMKQDKNEKKQLNVELKIFKNITEANKTLQDLLKNLKQLERVYKNDETSDSDSSESEIDEVFRQVSYNKKNKKKRVRKQTSTTNDPSNNYRGTAYIYEHQESVLGDEDAKDEKEEPVNAKDEKTSEEPSIENVSKTKTSSEKISGSEEIEPKTESDEVVEIKIDSEKKYESLALKPQTSLIINKPQSYPNNKDKTRFSVLHSSKDNINFKSGNSKKIPVKIGNQRIVYSEQFPPETIWDDIINRPIKLNRVISSEEASKLNPGENEKNTAKVITDNTKKEDTTNRLHDLETQQKQSNIAKDGDSTLRKGYGDECIQVPIKKCKKAMKAVNKNVCKRRFKCESDFKSDFDENSNKECVKKFSYNLAVSQETKYNISRVKKADYLFPSDDSSPDATRYRHPQYDLSLRNISRNVSTQLSLRDKYEKRCQKESREKCIAACNDATENTCSKHTCDKKKKKALTKACKEECKNIFVIDKESKDSSDDSSDSDSDSD